MRGKGSNFLSLNLKWIYIEKDLINYKLNNISNPPSHMKEKGKTQL